MSENSGSELTLTTRRSEGRGELLSDGNLSTETKVAEFLSQLLPVRSGSLSPVAAILPWGCDRLLSEHSRRAYARDLAAFVRHMEANGVEPLAVTGDDVRVYKAALLRSGAAATTVSRVLSVIRGTWQQFGKRGLVDWDVVQDIQSVESPRVEKNLTPALSQREAIRLLHAPDRSTIRGKRDHALLFVYFKTACRCSAVRNALVGHLERTDFEWYLSVVEQGGRRHRKALLEAAPAVLDYVESAGLRDDKERPLFRPMGRDRESLERRPLDRLSIWKIVKQYARGVGIDADRLGGRGIGVHSLRKTALTNALENGAPIEKVQQLAGHSDIRTTQLYYRQQARDAEDAARFVQIR